MFSWQEPKDRVAIVQMNAELRHAELELLSAQCATDRLRLRFSSEDIARFSQPDVLEKAIRAASALNEYYSLLGSKRSKVSVNSPFRNTPITEEQVTEGIARIARFLREQRETYFPVGVPIPEAEKSALQPFFSSSLLDHVRVLELKGTRVPNPPYYEEAKTLGFSNFPEMRHMASLTFLDVVVFNERLTTRALFHGLVHAVQFLVLGLDHYTDRFVRGFLRTHFHVTVPLEAQAFLLESRFLENPQRAFSVEDQVRLWVEESRY